MNETSIRAHTGVLHGRFQILHRDHLKYILAGKALCRHLVVAITNPDPRLSREEKADPHRLLPLSNPLTYYERYVMIRQTLAEAGISDSEFSVVPLPISFPELYRYYVPLDAIFFLSIYDAWGRQKKLYFEKLGLSVHVIRHVTPSEKGISGTHLRNRMLKDESWEHLVPPAVATCMKEWNITERLQALAASTRE